MVKTFGICIVLGALSMMSLFACTPLQPQKVPLGSALLEATGVIGYWSFDETSLGTAPGGADFNDSSGNGHHGKAVGTLGLGTYGVQGHAITSTGTGAVEIPLDLSHEKVVSISLWVNQHISGTNVSNVLMEYTPNSPANDGFFTALDDNSGTPVHALLMWMHGASGYFGRSTSSLNIGWHNVFVVFDKTNPSQNSITLRLDGSLISTTQYGTQDDSSGGTFANSKLYLLCRGGTSLCLKADIDELIVWNRAVTQEELEALYF